MEYTIENDEVIGIYNPDDLEEALTNDEITDEHQGFMLGYLTG